MSHFPATDLAAALRSSAGESVVDVEGHVLFSDRERPVFVPRGNARRDREALAFFTNGRMRRLAGTAALCLARFTGRPLPSASVTLPLEWRKRYDVDLGAAALYCGSPGPYQKVTLHVPSRHRGQSPTLFKIALRPSADVTVEREAACLVRLAGFGEEVCQHVPTLLGQGRLESGRSYLATVAESGELGSTRIEQPQLRLLGLLARATRKDVPWRHGTAMARTRERLDALPGDALPVAVRDILERALAELDAHFQNEAIPHTLMHGDFTRFNIRCHAGGFIVFDWEFAQDGSNPIADVLHFNLARPGRMNALGTVRSALSEAARFATATFDDWQPTAEDLTALALHLLIDTVLFFATADGRLELRSFIIRKYLFLIEARQAWRSGR
jgi:hypothetical protein